MSCLCKVRLRVDGSDPVPLNIRTNRSLDFDSNEYIDIRASAYAQILFNTRQGWADSGMISEEDTLYVVTDYKTIDGVTYAAIKVGDGLAYVVDLPCIEDWFDDHIANGIIHITAAERAFWNNKVSCYVNQDNLVFTTE